MCPWPINYDASDLKEWPEPCDVRHPEEEADDGSTFRDLLTYAFGVGKVLCLSALVYYLVRGEQ
jgi:hypothetical protein